MRVKSQKRFIKVGLFQAPMPGPKVNYTPGPILVRTHDCNQWSQISVNHLALWSYVADESGGFSGFFFWVPNSSRNEPTLSADHNDVGRSPPD